MKHYIFSIYDEKASAYLPPFILPTIGMAKRTFADCVNSKDHQFGAHPGDYCLVELGTFHDETGEIESHQVPQSLGLGLEYRETTGDLDHDESLSDGSQLQPSAHGRDS